MHQPRTSVNTPAHAGGGVTGPGLAGLTGRVAEGPLDIACELAGDVRVGVILFLTNAAGGAAVYLFMLIWFPVIGLFMSALGVVCTPLGRRRPYAGRDTAVR